MPYPTGTGFVPPDRHLFRAVLMRHTALPAVAAAVLVPSSAGCHALGSQTGLGLGGVLAGAPRPLSVSPVPGVLANAGDSIFAVVPWILALAVAAVVVILLVKALRGNAVLPGAH